MSQGGVRKGEAGMKKTKTKASNRAYRLARAVYNIDTYNMDGSCCHCGKPSRSTHHQRSCAVGRAIGIAKAILDDEYKNGRR